MQDIESIVIEVVKEIGEEQEIESLSEPDENTLLFGNSLDSLGVVLLATELEERINDELKLHITLADERAMSQKTSPFRSVKTLTKYINMLVKQELEQDP